MGLTFNMKSFLRYIETRAPKEPMTQAPQQWLACAIQALLADPGRELTCSRLEGKISKYQSQASAMLTLQFRRSWIWSSKGAIFVATCPTQVLFFTSCSHKIVCSTQPRPSHIYIYMTCNCIYIYIIMCVCMCVPLVCSMTIYG